MSQAVLIAGCGDVGTELGRRLVRDGATVFGLRRSREPLPGGMVRITADLTHPSLPSDMPQTVDHVVYCPTPSERTESGYRQIFVDAQARLRRRYPAARWSMVSSTAVYGQDGGQWVDEESACEPTRFNGTVLREAEAIALGTDGGSNGIVVRSAGIYGPGRNYLVNKVRRGEQARAQHFTNRIHRDDLAHSLRHLILLPEAQGIYNAVDNLPCTEASVMDFIAEQLGMPLPDKISSPPSNKRVSNQRLVSTGLELHYPTYREGYGQLAHHQ